MNNNILNIKIEIPGLELLAQAVMKLAEQKGAVVKVTDPATTAAPELAAPVPVQPAQATPQNMPGVAPVQPVPQNIPVAPVPVAATPAAPQSVVPVAPAQAMPQSVVPTTPQITAPAAPPQIPTTAVPITHTYDELAVAASQLVNMGKQVRLREILSGFGVNSLMELVPEKYAAFAGCLKAEGVKF